MLNVDLVVIVRASVLQLRLDRTVLVREVLVGGTARIGFCCDLRLLKSGSTNFLANTAADDQAANDDAQQDCRNLAIVWPDNSVDNGCPGKTCFRFNLG